MFELWFNFAVVVFTQLLLFVAYAYYTKRLAEVLPVLGQGVIIGIVIGLLSDLIWGKFFGLWSYTLGFGVLSLTLTAAFVYGFFATNILLMRRVRLVHFFAWTMVMMSVYEITNHFFRIWTYELPLPFFGLLMFLIVGYFGTAVFVAVMGHVFFRRRFFFIDNLFKK